MKTVVTPAAVRETLRGVRSSGSRVGFVPTMGALHGGHAGLVRSARDGCDYVVVSVFVNPKQFGPREDFDRYPRDEESDAALLETLGCDLLFVPRPRDIYSPNDRTRISVSGLADVLCGASRRGHFEGVMLVVSKLFNIVQPDEAFFGQKDAQQAVIIQRMTADLDFPVRIRIGPTVRESDGLAMSSRNRYLDDDERKRAAALYGALRAARALVTRGERDPAAVADAVRSGMEAAAFDVEYAAVVDGRNLIPMERVEGTVLVAAAGRLGRTRLIDNIALTVAGDSVEEAVLEFPEWSRYEFER